MIAIYTSFLKTNMDSLLWRAVPGSSHMFESAVISFTSRFVGSSWSKLLAGRLLFRTEGFDLLFVGNSRWARQTFCCFSVGDAAKNGQGNSTASESQSTGSQHQGLATMSPSGPASCWCGFLNGSSRINSNTTRIGDDTAERYESTREPPQVLQYK